MILRPRRTGVGQWVATFQREISMQRVPIGWSWLRVATLEARFADNSKDVVAATRMANLKHWPSYSKTDDVTGEETKIYRIKSFYFANYKVNRESPDILFIFIIITAFEIKELQGLCHHFGGVLQHAEIDLSRWNWNGRCSNSIFITSELWT